MKNRLRHGKHLRSQKWVRAFTDPHVFSMYPARNMPQRAILVLNKSGKFQLHAQDFATGFTRQITKKSQGALFGSISPGGEYVFFLNDQDGAEHGHFVRAPFTGGKSVDITPSLPPYYSYGVSVSDSGDLLCFSASIDKENRVYLVSFDEAGRPKPPRLIYKTKQSIQGVIMSPNGKHTCLSLVATGTKPASKICLIENKTSRIVATILDGGNFLPDTFSTYRDEITVLGLTNRDGLYRPMFLHFNPDKKINPIAEKSLKGDLFVLGWIEGVQKLVMCEVSGTRQRLIIYDLKTHKVRQIGPRAGSFDLFFNSISILSDLSMLIRWHSFSSSPQIYKLSPPDHENNVRVKKSVESVEFPSSDGTQVQMWIAQPPKTKSPCPFIINIHGGPHSIVGDEFYPPAQTWLDNGYGFCSVNYRGSIGFGKDFQDGIYGNPGHWEVEDVVAAYKWLVKKRLADPKKVILVGYSWGGYVTLLALGKYPDLWVGGIASAPIADCIKQYEDEPAFFQALDRERFGGSPSTVPKVYARSSPVSYAKDFQAPILIIHGKNDVRCPRRQIGHFKSALKAHKKSIDVSTFSSGHTGGFTDLKIRIANMKRSLRFANQIIKNPHPSL